MFISIKIQNIIWEIDDNNIILPNKLTMVLDTLLAENPFHRCNRLTEENINEYCSETICFLSDTFNHLISSADIDIEKCICLKENISFYKIKSFFTTYELTEMELHNLAVAELKDNYAKCEFVYISKNNYCNKPDYNVLLSFVKQNIIKKIDDYMDNTEIMNRCLNNFYFKKTFFEEFSNKHKLPNIDINRVSLNYHDNNIEVYIDIPHIKEGKNMEVYIVSVRNKESGLENISSVAFTREEAELMSIYAKEDKAANPDYKEENYEFVISKGNLSMEQVRDYVSTKIETMSVDEVQKEIILDEIAFQNETEERIMLENSISAEEINNMFEEER